MRKTSRSACMRGICVMSPTIPGTSQFAFLAAGESIVLLPADHFTTELLRELERSICRIAISSRE